MWQRNSLHMFPYRKVWSVRVRLLPSSGVFRDADKGRGWLRQDDQRYFLFQQLLLTVLPKGSSQTDGTTAASEIHRYCGKIE